jgi:hypothetical protein
MRGTIAYYFVLIYITVMFRPLIPVIKDTFSHAFSEAIHMATVHAVYGSNHLQKELDNTTDNSNGKHHAGSGFEEQVPVHVSANEYVHYIKRDQRSRAYSCLELYKLKAGFIIKFSPPPKLS